MENSQRSHSSVSSSDWSSQSFDSSQSSSWDSQFSGEE